MGKVINYKLKNGIKYLKKNTVETYFLKNTGSMHFLSQLAKILTN